MVASPVVIPPDYNFDPNSSDPIDVSAQPFRVEVPLRRPITAATIGRNHSSTATKVVVENNPDRGLITVEVFGAFGGMLARIPFYTSDLRVVVSGLAAALKDIESQNAPPSTNGHVKVDPASV